jgi:UDP-N-acetylmuramyl pentapeptide synthase
VHEAVRELDDVVRPGDAVLVKASRAVGLEAVAAALTELATA